MRRARGLALAIEVLLCAAACAGVADDTGWNQNESRDSGASQEPADDEGEEDARGGTDASTGKDAGGGDADTSSMKDAGAADADAWSAKDAGKGDAEASSGKDAGAGDADATAGEDAGDSADASTTVCQEPPNVFALPSTFGVPHATKALLACGVYVIGSAAVSDAALIRAQGILQVELHKLCDDLPGTSDKFMSTKSRIVVLGKKEDQSIYWPKQSGRRSFCSWPDANGMIETTTLEEELTSSNRSLLMTTVHEMGHFTQFALSLYNRPLYDRSVKAFQSCTKSLYNNYDLLDEMEFFAGDTLRWYDLNPSDLAVSDAASLAQREQLRKYSPTMHQIMSEVFYTTAIP